MANNNNYRNTIFCEGFRYFDIKKVLAREAEDKKREKDLELKNIFDTELQCKFFQNIHTRFLDLKGALPEYVKEQEIAERELRDKLLADHYYADTDTSNVIYAFELRMSRSGPAHASDTTFDLITNSRTLLSGCQHPPSQARRHFHRSYSTIESTPSHAQRRTPNLFPPQQYHTEGEAFAVKTLFTGTDDDVPAGSDVDDDDVDARSGDVGEKQDPESQDDVASVPSLQLDRTLASDEKCPGDFTPLTGVHLHVGSVSLSFFEQEMQCLN